MSLEKEELKKLEKVLYSSEETPRKPKTEDVIITC